ncbi:hypothetical protein C8F01DRAFT_1275430 [Mycena amicta]|nr:hypothetical protein C8F01DRAFT_1275430 [Mycena amicta]
MTLVGSLRQRDGSRVSRCSLDYTVPARISHCAKELGEARTIEFEESGLKRNTEEKTGSQCREAHCRTKSDSGSFANSRWEQFREDAGKDTLARKPAAAPRLTQARSPIPNATWEYTKSRCSPVPRSYEQEYNGESMTRRSFEGAGKATAARQMTMRVTRKVIRCYHVTARHLAQDQLESELEQRNTLPAQRLSCGYAAIVSSMSSGFPAPPACHCTLRPFPHEIAAKDWNAHQAELQASQLASTITPAEIDHITLESARIVLDENYDSQPIDPDPSSLVVDMQQAAEKLLQPGPGARKPQVAAQKRRQMLISDIAKDVESAIQSLQSLDASHSQSALWAKADKAQQDISLVTLSLQGCPDSPTKTSVITRLCYLEPYAFDNPVEHLHIIAQLMVIFALICSTILGLARKPVNFIIDYMRFLIKLAFRVHSLSTTTSIEDLGYGSVEDDIIGQLPTSLYNSMNQLKLEGKTTLYAVCPACHHLHAPTVSPTKAKEIWISQCENVVVGAEGRSTCRTSLLDHHRHPLKSFLSPSFLDYVARLLSNPELEELIEKSPIDATAWAAAQHEFIDSVLQAELIQKFKGPGEAPLFIKQAGRLPIAFSIGVDYFPPRGSGIHSSSASIGVLKLSCLNLPISLRNAPENVYASILPGPSAPNGAFLNPYLKPVIDVAVAGWERGVWLSRTAKRPQGHLLSLATPLSINDLPAARQMAAPFAFPLEWYPLTPATAAEAPENVAPERKYWADVARLQRLLQRELDDEDLGADDDDDVGDANSDVDVDDSEDDVEEANEDTHKPKRRGPDEVLTTEILHKRIGGYTKGVLIWVCWSLKLRAACPPPAKPPKKTKVTDEEWKGLTLDQTLTFKFTLKTALVEPLMTWVSSLPCFRTYSDA